MPIKKKRCQVCHRWFTPDPRTAHQVCCASLECRRQHKAAMNKRWRLINPDYDKFRAGKKRLWARVRGYWRHYRQTHPAYAAADIKRRCKSYRTSRISANQAVIAKIAVEKLASIRAVVPNPSANQAMIARRVDVIVDYLFLKEASANPRGTDFGVPSGP